MKFKQLLELARPYRGPLGFLALVTAAAAMVSLAVTWFAGSLLGGIVEGSAQGTDQARLVGGLLLCIGCATLLNIAASMISVRTDTRILADLRQKMFEHVQRLPIGFHESRGKGDTLAMMTYEVWRLSQFLTGTLASTPARLLTTIGAVAAMFRIDARLAMIVPVLVPIFYLVLKIVGRSLRGRAAALQHAEAQLVEIAEQSLEMLPATKAFTREQVEAGRYRSVSQEVSQLAIRQGQTNALIDPLLGLITTVAAVLVLLLAGQGVRQGQLDASNLFSFIFYAGLLTRPVSALAHIYGELQVAQGTLERMQSVLDQPLEEIGPSERSGWRAKGKIEFREVHFAYPGRDPLIEDFNLTIGAGERVALLGPNGSGKTALINLLLRYYDPQGGEILLDDEPIPDLNLPDLRRQIGLVPQLPLLFNASIRDNIAFGSHDAGVSQVEEAAATAQALEFILALPHGFDTMIGDRGVQLSGGQRQRIALARALIKDPPILIFDEATSMFDLDSEELFIGRCLPALEGRTVVMITHRPAILKLADRVVHIGSGSASGQERLVEPIPAEAAE